MSFFNELKRRNVIKVAGAYLALAWVVVQATGAIVPALNLPATLVPTVVWIGIIGFPCVLIFSWVYELTPEGLKRESEVDRSQSITHVTSRRLDYIIIGMLAVAMLMFVLDRIFPGDVPPAGAGHARDESRADADADADAEVGVGHARDAEADRAQSALPQQTPTPVPDEKSIAVLPFTDMSAAGDQAYMSDGIAEELLNLLARIPELKVIARTSSFAFKGKEANIKEIASTLNVAHVLEGSVRTAGNRIRITAQLIRTADSTHVWSQTYDRTLDDIFAVQDEIAAAVVEQLRIKLLGAAPTARAVDPEAYSLYLQSRQLNTHGARDEQRQAIGLLQQALVIEPEFAAAWRLLGILYLNLISAGDRTAEESYALGREAIQKALALDPQLAIAHASMGLIAESHDGNLPAAAEHYQRALALEPTNPSILWYAAQFAANLGRLDTAIALQNWANTHDPLLPNGHFNLGFFYLAGGRPDDALASIRVANRLAPQSGGSAQALGLAMLLKGDPDAALAAMQDEQDESLRLSGMAMVLHSLGRRAESDAQLAELVRKYPEQVAMLIAETQAWRGERDAAFEWLDAASKNKDQGLLAVAIDPFLRNLHDDPRWLPFLRRIDRAPEQLAAIPFEVKLPQQ